MEKRRSVSQSEAGHTTSEARVVLGSVQMVRTLVQHEREETARKYYPMAVAIAKWRHKKLPASYVQLNDMISATGEGLARALNTYNPCTGTPLGRWVAFCAHAQITDDLRLFIRRDLRNHRIRCFV